MKQRILVAIIGVPALIGVLCFAPDWATAVLVAALCVIGCHEFMGAAAPEKAAHWWGLAATLAVFTVFTVYFSGGDFTGTAIHTIMVWLLAALIVVMFIAAVQAFGKDDELDFPDISAMAVSGLVIPLALGCLVRLRMLEYGAGLVLIPLVLAGYARYLKGIDDNGQAFEPSTDPLLAELQAIVNPLEVKEGEQDFSCLKKLYSRADVFGVDLYAVGLGEKIEGMVKELYAGNGAVRKTLHKYTLAR